MARIEVAVMEPKYQVNLGYIARISKNFGADKLILINPRCNYKGKNAIKYSKHARELLEKAQIARGISSIRTGLLIGTTGIWHKTNASYYNVYKLGRLSKLLGKRDSITILLGRDDTGLSKEELKLCDATLFIEASKEYPILNISHALAIILSQLFSLSGSSYKHLDRLYADEKYQKSLIKLFGKLVGRNKRIRDKKSVKQAFRHILRRSNPTKKEVNALAIALAN